ncbi:hypothetical protein RN51_01399 [Microbacterium oxydans]|uniref:Uncharacterized protein n=1 Tax=Microbacterium oxydans TaxID=82380 RepID=A0A0F0KSL7_9MICO|nr:hypothetical protein [Microbacterium oxydans]KJL23863.1 hypothetical protein RN51_01399 [Microbacterium oxydans]
MTDPQLPPPSGAVPSDPPAPPAVSASAATEFPSGAFPPPAAPAYPAAAPAYPPVAPAYPQSAPAGYPAAPAPGYPATPPGYPAAPPGAYQVPVGGYAAPSGAYQVPATPAPSSSRLFGTLALVLSLVAAVVPTIVVSISAFEIGRYLPNGASVTADDLRVLTPVRDQVLWAELSFWLGTLVGIAAIVLGIIAIAKKRGRGAGIAALVVAVLASAIFFIALVVALTSGATAGLSSFTA